MPAHLEPSSVMEDSEEIGGELCKNILIVREAKEVDNSLLLPAHLEPDFVLGKGEKDLVHYFFKIIIYVL